MSSAVKSRITHPIGYGVQNGRGVEEAVEKMFSAFLFIREARVKDFDAVARFLTERETHLSGLIQK